MLSEFKILGRLLFCLLFSLGVHAGVVLFEWSRSPVADSSALNRMEVSLVAAPAVEPATMEPAAVTDVAVSEPAVMAPPDRSAARAPAPGPQRPPENPGTKPKQPLPASAAPAGVSQQGPEGPVATEALSGAQRPPVKPASAAQQSLSAQSPPEHLPANEQPRQKPSAFPSDELVGEADRRRHQPKSSPAEAAASRTVSARPAGSARPAETTPPSAPPAAEMTSAEPRYRSNPLPEYPYLARQRHWEGLVWLLVSVSAEGRVDDLQVAESSGYGVLDKSAMKTVRRWRFSPAKRGGLPVESMVKVPVRFRLEE
jgi:protein TonB